MKKMIVGFFIVCFSISLVAQEKFLLEIDDQKITADEFLHIYKKNNTNSDAMTYVAMKEYMDLFINFKLKVIEAQNLGLDTTLSFIQELSGYRSQLAQPYLTDKKVEEETYQEAYERMKYDIHVSHILIKVDQMASPEDSLAAWNKISDIYKKLEKGGDFIKLAKEFSEDESVKTNNGDLGYRTVFGLVYEFETAMYETEIGKFSKPFRTRFGYHILKVNNKREAKGKYKVAHIMTLVPKDAGSGLDKKAKEKIEEAQAKLLAGEDFAKVAEEYSEDRRSASEGGVLGWVSVGGKMIKEFEDAVFSLEKTDDMSPILKTSYGFHLIKLIEIEDIKPYEEVKNEIKSKISNTARTSKSRETVIQNLMLEYNAKTFNENVKDMYKIVTDSIFAGSWQIEKGADLSKPLLSFADKTYTLSDFVDYLMKFNRKQSPQNIQVFVDTSFKNFLSKMIIMYEEEVLEDKYPAFKYLIKEYHDGILLFELTDKTVWSKAITDTVGLEAFYNQNKNNYMWSYRYSTKTYQCADAKTQKAMIKALNKSTEESKILAKLNKKNPENVTLTQFDIAEKGVKVNIDNIIEEHNLHETDGFVKVIPNLENNTVTAIRVHSPEIKTLNEARGIITADYQNYLEKEWLKELRLKYKFVLHEDVLKSIAQ